MIKYLFGAPPAQEASPLRVEAGGASSWEAYPCVRYNVYDADTLVQEICAASMDHIEGGGDRIVHVSVLIAFDAGFSKLSKQPVTLLEVIESEAMETGMVTIDAEATAKGIDATGHIAIYGVYFDTGSADIKPESSTTLAEISKLLSSRPSLKLLVVGHTDNKGEYEYNKGLSGRRASSVARALTGQYGIDSARLRSAGVGYLAPVASNDTEEGRRKNRRVELVKQ